MTKEEAKKILIESEELEPLTTRNGETFYFKVSDNLFFDYPDDFAFGVHSYSSKNLSVRVNTWQYFVHKFNGLILCSDSPMTEEELIKLGRDKETDED